MNYNKAVFTIIFLVSVKFPTFLKGNVKYFDFLQ